MKFYLVLHDIYMGRQNPLIKQGKKYEHKSNRFNIYNP